MKRLANGLMDWLDHRSGLRELIHEALYEHIPGGARWRYVWGSTLAVAFVTQLITGIFLWMSYSPSTVTAWESVYFIQYETNGGWLLRGVHHFMAQAMVVLMAIHLAQVVIYGAYRAPRELNFVLGLVLMLIVLGLSLTGYLLPWDQKGYWATNVGTELAGQAPVAGQEVKKLAVGGPNYGHQTLTRFFALHAGVLPGLLIFFLVWHLMLFRRHGVHAGDTKGRPDATFWPDQLLRDVIVSLIVLVIVFALAIYFHGAELGAPADPSSPYSAARPEWYFLFMFQFLKWFPGESEQWGAFYIPAILLFVMALMPWIGRNKIGHAFNVLFLFVLLGGAALLTGQALHDDYYARIHDEDAGADADEAAAALHRKKYEASLKFLKAKEQAHVEGKRIVELAGMPEKIPAAGALSLLQADAKIQGPKLFARYCASCHNYAPPGGEESHDQIVNPNPTAPNLYDFGSRAWIAGLLNPERIVSPHYFGYKDSPFAAGDMVSYVVDIWDVNPEDKADVAAEFKKVTAALSAEAALPYQVKVDAEDTEMIAEGVQLITGDAGCTDCHKFQDIDYDGGAPDLTGYASREWLQAFVSDPSHARFYGESNDRMPSFAKNNDDHDSNLLEPGQLEMIVDWLRGDWPERPADE